MTIGTISTRATAAGILLATALLPSAASAQVATTSPFALACLTSGGTTGRVTVRTANRARLYLGTTAVRLSLSFSSNPDVFSISLAVAGQPAGDLPNLTMRPGEGRFLFASRLDIDGMGGTVGKDVEYCLRAD
jgi:hypothetical protein